MKPVHTPIVNLQLAFANGEPIAPLHPHNNGCLHVGASSPARGVRAYPYFAVPKHAHDAIMASVDGTDAVYCLAVYASLRRLANDHGSADGPVALTINTISSKAGSCYRKVASILKKLESLGVISIEGTWNEDGKSRAPSRYAFLPPSSGTACATPGTACAPPGTACLTSGTEEEQIGAEIIKEQKENKEHSAVSAPPAFPLAVASKTKLPRSRDLLLDTIALLETKNLGEVTQSAWRACAKALSEIREVCPSVTPQEIQQRAERYQRIVGVAVTALGLAKHWARCGSSNQKSTTARLPQNMRPETPSQ